MPRFLSPQTIFDSSQRLILSKARSGFVDFLVLKRALQRAEQSEISFSSRDPDFTGAMKDLAATFPQSEQHEIPATFKPFVKVFGTAGAVKYMTRKWTTNGPADTLAGPKWSSAVQIVGTNPRRGGLKLDYVPRLSGLILKTNGDLPSILDSAVWYYRATNLEDAYGDVADTTSLRDRLCEGFVSALGLTEEELVVLFDRVANPFEGMELAAILQDASADPQQYLPDLETGTGNLRDLVSSFTRLARRDDVRASMYRTNCFCDSPRHLVPNVS